MRIKEFSQVLLQLESTSGRIEMTQILADFLPQLADSEIKQAMYLMQGRLVPSYTDLEFNFSAKLAMRAFALHVHPDKEIPEEAASDVSSKFKKLGDLGLVAEALLGDPVKGAKSSKNGVGLSISEAYAQLEKIARHEGKGSQEAKVAGFGELIRQLDPLSARYITRVVIGNLRLGLSDKTILDALSWAVTGDKSLRPMIEKAYGARADIGEMAQIVLTSKPEGLEEKLTKITIKPGIPVASKLVEREKTAAAVFSRTGECIAQPKLDGLRAQIHLINRDEVEIYSRNMESLTQSFPDLVRAAKELGVSSVIIDSEAVGFDFESETFLPFQDTISRRRKHDIDNAQETIPVKAMAFDLLYLNGEDLSWKPVTDRLELLQKLLKNSKQKTIDLLDSPRLDSEEELEAYFQEQIGLGLEGIIVKKLDTAYEPGTRNFDWIKLKANTQSHLVDTIDCVVLGYFAGRGVRAKFGIGALLVGLYHPGDGKFYSVAKVGTGMKDEDWIKIKQDLEPLTLEEKPDNVEVMKANEPSVWVRPEIVMEIDADEITRSPNHIAAYDIPADFESDTKGRGLSLRFPRMKVWDRDKNPEQATTVQELVRMYQLRKSPKNGRDGSKKSDKPNKAKVEI